MTHRDVDKLAKYRQTLADLLSLIESGESCRLLNSDKAEKLDNIRKLRAEWNTAEMRQFLPILDRAGQMLGIQL